MTGLDAHPHTTLGELLRIPVSRPHQAIDRAGEFVATATDLVLGEGSGGHSAAVVPIAWAVGEYLCEVWATAASAARGEAPGYGLGHLRRS